MDNGEVGFPATLSKASQASSTPVQKGIHITSLSSIPAIQLDVLSCIPLWSNYTLNQKKLICILLSYQIPQTNTQGRQLLRHLGGLRHKSDKSFDEQRITGLRQEKSRNKQGSSPVIKSLTSALSLRHTHSSSHPSPTPPRRHALLHSMPQWCGCAHHHSNIRLRRPITSQCVTRLRRQRLSSPAQLRGRLVWLCARFLLLRR